MEPQALFFLSRWFNLVLIKEPQVNDERFKFILTMGTKGLTRLMLSRNWFGIGAKYILFKIIIVECDLYLILIPISQAWIARLKEV